MGKFNLIVAGGRDFANYPLLCRAIDGLRDSVLSDYEVVIISGGARGADQLGELYARQVGLRCIVQPADWNTHGKRAGHLRNEQMGDQSQGLLAFWDGESRGTRHMIAYMRNLGKPTKTIKY